MLLAEALALRSDAQNRLAALQNRLVTNAKVQEGTEPAEDPAALLAEADALAAELLRLVQRIHRTNAATPFDATRSLSDALAERDVLKLRRRLYDSLLAAASERVDRYRATELRTVSAVDVSAVRKQADALGRAYRELDTRLQQLNWSTELRE